MKFKNLFVLLFTAAFISTAIAEIPEVKNKTHVGYYNRALAEFNYGNASAAMENINKALELKLDYADALSYRGYFHQLNKDYDKAITDYLAAEKLSPNVNGYFTALPFALKGDKDAAFKWLESSLTATVNRADIAAIKADKNLESLHADPRWNTLLNKNWYSPYELLIQEGNSKLSSGDREGAITAFTKAIESDATKDAAYERRAYVYIAKGDMDKALADLIKAIRINGRSVYYGNRAYCLKKLGRYNEALADYDKAIELDPQNMVYADRAGAKEKIDMKDKSIAKDYETYLDAFYKDDFTYFFLASYHFAAGWAMGASIYAEKAIEYNNKEAEYYKLDGMAQIRLKYYTTSIMALDKAIQLKPDDGELFYLRGVAKGEKKDSYGACEDFRTALRKGYQDAREYADACK
jgi:tetratricopeptide (TPR) repeat protein